MSAPPAERQRQHRTVATLTLELQPPETTSEPSEQAQDPSEYRKHSLAAGYWGGIPSSQRPMRFVPAEEADVTILRGLLDTPTDRRERNPLDWLISVAVHIVIVGAVVIAPLAFTQAIDLRGLQLTYLTVPKPPAAAPPPPPAVRQSPTRTLRAIRTAQLTAPIAIPKKIAIVKDDSLPETDLAGVVGGIPGGETGGILGGILGGTQSAPAPPPPAQKKTVYRVGGDVKPPRQISVVQPEYSPVARLARVEGVVVVEAVIDEHGDVVEARAVSGPGLLMPAAVRAVAQWKYEPTYLDGTPVPIRMQVEVNFHLH